MMKIRIFASVLITFLIFGCDADFIDLAPISNVNTKNFYSTPEDMNVALNGAYGTLQATGLYGRHLAIIPEYRGGNAWLSWMEGAFDYESIIEFSEVTNNPLIQSIWQDSYKSILVCNAFLDRIVPIEFDQTLKNRYIGEAKFIRALIYFNLVRVFGDIPVVTQELSSIEKAYEHGREPVSRVYEQIISDLSDAEQYLPESYAGTDVGRATKGAAKALLGKAHLTQKEYTLARDELKEVIDMGIYELLPDYGFLWDLNHENSMESIFEIQYKKGGTGTGSSYANDFAPKFSAPYTVAVGAGNGQMCPTQDMEDEYEPGDLRKDVSMVAGYYGKDNVWIADKWCIKYHDVPFVANDNDNNWPVIRYADVLLMYAEALNEIGYIPDGEAFMFLNQVRERAGLDAKTAANNDPFLSVPNQEAFREAIDHERRVELAFEGHRFFDLVRWGTLVEKMSQFYFGNDVKEHHVLFAVPQREIDINPEMILQNPGY